MIVAKPLEGNTDNANFSAFYVSRDFIIFFICITKHQCFQSFFPRAMKLDHTTSSDILVLE